MTIKIIVLLLLLASLCSGQYASRNLSENLGSGALPAACTIGDLVFRTDAVANENILGCTAANTWTLQTGNPLTRDAIGETSTPGFVLINNTAATAVLQQWSPSIVLEGRSYDNVGAPQSRWTRWIIENQSQESQAECGGAGSQNNCLAGLGISFQAEGYNAIRFFHMTHDPNAVPAADIRVGSMFLGFGAGGTSITGQAFNLIGIGTNALGNNTSGRENICIGNGCLYWNTTGIWNNCIGIECLLRNTTGEFNTALGQDAGGGSQSREGNATGDYNVFLGVGTQPNTFTERDYMTVIGAYARGDQSDAGFLGTSGIQWTAGGMTKTRSTFEVVDPSTLAGETLSETDFATTFDWAPAGDWAFAGQQAVYTHNAGFGFLNQDEVDFAITPAIGSRWYEFSYDVISYTADVHCEIGGTFGELEGGVNLPLQLESQNYPRTFTIHLKAIANPTVFFFDCGSISGEVTIDNVSLKEILGGDILINNDMLVDALKLRDGSLVHTDSADVASAGGGTTTLPVGNLFHITGVNNITTLNTCGAANNGRLVTLIFDAILTFTDGVNLVLAGNFVTTADDVIQLACDGSNWYEVSRSVN